MTIVAPAAADPLGPQEYNRSIIRNQYTGRCLDSNWNGDVYTLICSGSYNPYQTWEIWNGGWTKNVATGKCLSIIQQGYKDYKLTTEGCYDYQYQWWTHWNGGWYQNYQRDWHSGKKLCLISVAWAFDRNPEYDLGTECVDEVPQHWRANLTG